MKLRKVQVQSSNLHGSIKCEQWEVCAWRKKNGVAPARDGLKRGVVGFPCGLNGAHSNNPHPTHISCHKDTWMLGFQLENWQQHFNFCWTSGCHGLRCADGLHGSSILISSVSLDRIGKGGPWDVNKEYGTLH